MLQQEGNGAVCPLEMEPLTLRGLCSSEGPWGPAWGVPSLGEDRRDCGCPSTPQVMVLVQETPTSPSQHKHREWLPSLLPGVPRSNTSISCSSAAEQFLPGIPANSLTSSGISALWEGDFLQCSSAQPRAPGSGEESAGEQDGVSVSILQHEVTVPFRGPATAWEAPGSGSLLPTPCS